MEQRRQVETPTGETVNETNAVIEYQTETNEKAASVAIWAKKAASQAVFERTADLPGFHAYFEGAKGAWGMGKTRDEAQQELEEVLIDWAMLTLDETRSPSLRCEL